MGRAAAACFAETKSEATQQTMVAGIWRVTKPISYVIAVQRTELMRASPLIRQSLLPKYRFFRGDHRETEASRVTGEYDFADSPQPAPWSFTVDGALQGLSFTRLPPVALHTLPADPRAPDDYQVGDVYRPICTRLLWTAATGAGFLRAIAEEQLSAFFVSVDYGCLLAPYAGGLDLIFPGEAARNYFRNQYRPWVSPRADGL